MIAAIVLAATAVSASADADFETGLARFQARDFAGARAPLEAAHRADPGDLDVDLLLGITYFRLGRDREARPLLIAAAGSTDADAAASARLFLGLIASRRGDLATARGLFTQVAASGGALASTGRALLSDDGARWTFDLLLTPELDSNVPIQAATNTPGASGADADAFVVATGTVRAGRVAFTDTASYRKQATLTDFDLLFDSIEVAARWSGDHDRVAASDRVEGGLLGGAAYEVGDVGDLAWRHSIGALALGLHYTFAARDYLADAYSGYTGVAHTGVAEIGWAKDGNSVIAGAVGVREGASDSTLAATGGGGRVDLDLRRGDVEVAASADTIARAFDGGRRDLELRADAVIAIDVSDRVSAVVGAIAVRNRSSDASFTYTKLVGYAGLDLRWSGL